MSSPDDERGLDPDDWEAVRAVGHKLVDELLDALRTVRTQPAWRPIPEALKARFRTSAPMEGAGPEAVHEEFLATVLPYRLGNIHPRFFARVMGTGTPMGALAEFAAAAMNNNLSGLESSAVHVEAQVLRWLKALLGFPETASGLLTSGCSIANLIALQVARDEFAGVDVNVEGVQASRFRLVAYASDEVHSAVQRALMVLGLGSTALRRVPTGPDFRMRVEDLEDRIDDDVGRGLRPFCIVGSCGTVNTGAIDPLDAMADLAARRKLWFHVDGAFGALAALSPRLKDRVKGLERAHSVAFDLHKWGAAPYGLGVVLVRDAEAHHRAFQTEAAYLAPLPRGVAQADYPANELGPELSRGFRGLPIWMAWKEHGVSRLARTIEMNVAQALHVKERVGREPELELMAPVGLNLVTFRYVGKATLLPERLDALQAEIVMRVQESGVAVPSTTKLRGRTVIRLAIVNHRTRRADLDLLLDAVLREGRAAAAAFSP
jgi:glutamate/tyrosine decarboxylase-like PLP-dependent enzyme